MFLKNKNIIFKIRRSKVTDYAALMLHLKKFAYLDLWQFLTNYNAVPLYIWGSIRMDHVISEPCCKGTILQRNYSHFPIFPFLKFHDEKIWEPQHDCVISKSVL